MAINISNIKTRVNEMIAQGALTPAQIVQFNYIIKHYDEAYLLFASSVGALPDPTLNTGRFAYVSSDQTMAYSDGVTWTLLGMPPAPPPPPPPVTQTFYTWGQNLRGELGDNTSVAKSSPVYIVGSTISWGELSMGNYATAAVGTDGSLWTWGSNVYGELGDGTTENRSSPVTVAGGGNIWSQVSIGRGHMAAVKTDGTLWTWGYNGYGSLGDGTTDNKSSPEVISSGSTDWNQVSAGSKFTAAIKTDGTLWAWGYNYNGQLGNDTTTDAYTPEQVAGGGTNWKYVSAGGYHTTAVKHDGTLWVWGENQYDQLGTGGGNATSSPVTTAGGGTDWFTVSAGYNHTVALKQDGTLWAWGMNDNGQLGDGTVDTQTSPVTVAGGGTNWVFISAGGYHTIANKTDGTLWAWGNNFYGQLGDGTTNERSVPVSVIGSGKYWSNITAGDFSSAAINQIPL